MDKDRIKGKAEDIAGRVKRQAGEWTGDSDLQAEGTAQQAKGKVQNTWGKAKDAARDAAEEVNKEDRAEKRRDEDAA